MKRRPAGERGAVGAITAAFLAAALGLSAVVVDVGHAWQERRHVITATDAAALAAAIDYVEGTDGCATSAGAYVTQNHAAATMTSCVRTVGSGSTPDRVTVEAESTIGFFFAQIVGVANTTVDSSTTVNYDHAETVSGGLRPFGLCVDFLAEIEPPTGPTPDNGIIYRIYYGRTAQATNCNGGDPISGNWGILDFDGGSNSNQDIKDWTQDGYTGPPDVAIGDWIEGTPGSFSNSLNSELTHLINNVDHFTLPIFSEYNDLGGGNAEFLIHNFAEVTLHGFQTTGAQDDRYIDLEFVNGVTQGGGGGPGGLGAYVIGICAVDGVNEATACS
ncbi:MAG: pilus assembly protein TadG-related protein [Acidimicrobiales bacterium]